MQCRVRPLCHFAHSADLCTYCTVVLHWPVSRWRNRAAYLLVKNHDSSSILNKPRARRNQPLRRSKGNHFSLMGNGFQDIEQSFQSLPLFVHVVVAVVMAGLHS